MGEDYTQRKSERLQPHVPDLKDRYISGLCLGSGVWREGVGGMFVQAHTNPRWAACTATPAAHTYSAIVRLVVVGLVTDTKVRFSRRGEALKVNKLTFIIRASDSSWHPGLPGRPGSYASRESQIGRVHSDSSRTYLFG